MKTLTIEQLVLIHGGSRKALACLSQGLSGVSVLAGIAAGLAFATNPVGRGILIRSGAGLILGAAADPAACD